MKISKRLDGEPKLRIRILSAALLTILTAATWLPAAAEPDNYLIGGLREFLPRLMKQTSTPGLSIALAREGRIIWKEGFGFADLEKKIPMTPDSILRAGSMSKTYVATAVMQLVERGILRLSDPVNRHIDDLGLKNPLGDREILIQDLLTHTSGLNINPGGCLFREPRGLERHIREDHGLEMFKSYEGTLFPRWSAKVGEKLQYSNFGVAILGLLVEKTNPEGLSLSDYIRKNIISPLGMRATVFPPFLDAEHVETGLRSRLTRGYVTYGSVNIPTPLIHIEDYPAGSLLTVPGDHVKLLLAYMNGGMYNGNRILQSSTVRTMLEPHVSWAEMKMDIGLIWMLHDSGKETFRFSHGGAYMYGWSGNFYACPGRKLALVVMTNQWPMTARMEVPDLVFDYVMERLVSGGRSESRRKPEHSWAWKTSYVAAILLMDEMKGSLGIPEEVNSEMMEAMTSGARELISSRNRESVWDPEGFRCGIQDMKSVRMTRAGISEFIRSGRLRVHRAELDILYRELGGRRFPLK